MVGYLGRAEDTAAILTSHGWLRSGDLGFVDACGNISIVDRLKELIKVNAFQVAPAEVEAVLVAHPAVSDAAVVGRPDPRTGEAPVAYVVADAALDVDELAAFVGARVSAYKRPATIRVVEQLPRTPSGKLLRRQLRRWDPDAPDPTAVA